MFISRFFELLIYVAPRHSVQDNGIGTVATLSLVDHFERRLVPAHQEKIGESIPAAWIGFIGGIHPCHGIGFFAREHHPIFQGGFLCIKTVDAQNLGMSRNHPRIVFHIIYRSVFPCLNPKREDRIVFDEYTVPIVHSSVGKIKMLVLYQSAKIAPVIKILPFIVGLYSLTSSNLHTSVPLFVAHSPASGYIGILYAVDNKIDLIQIQTVDRVHKPSSLYAVHNGRRNILFLAESADRKYRK